MKRLKTKATQVSNHITPILGTNFKKTVLLVFKTINHGWDPAFPKSWQVTDDDLGFCLVMHWVRLNVNKTTSYGTANKQLHNLRCVKEFLCFVAIKMLNGNKKTIQHVSINRFERKILLLFIFLFTIYISRLLRPATSPIFQQATSHLFHAVVKYSWCSSGLTSLDPCDIMAAGDKAAFH